MQRNSMLALVLVLAGLGACKKSSDSSTPTPTPTPTTTPAYTTDDFWMDATVNAGMTYYIHEAADWTKACKILGSDSATDMTCILEMEELDLYVKGVTLNYHVPSDTCAYFTERPYYYWAWEPARGPRAVTLTIPAGPVLVTSAGNGAKATVSYNGSSLACGADYTSQTGPNCCYGDYALTTNDTTAGSSTTTLASWGSSFTGCISGPATATQPKTTYGIPKTTISYLNNASYDGSYIVSGPLDKDLLSLAYIANYFVGPPYDIGSAPTPVQGPVLGTVPSGNPYYEYTCIDHAGDVRHRIRLFIRAWSKDSEFAKKSAGDFVSYGVEGIPFTDQQTFDFNAWPTNTDPDPTTLHGWGNTYPSASN